MATNKLGESRETWCAVEKMKEEDFCRAQRKHFDIHLQQSAQTGQAAEIPVQSRCEWKPEKPKLKERKHFSHTFDSRLVL
ncbi:spermatogenesis-associated protein 45-like [Watersipora subatra]|uniref:spermatogenesis-associated protein 45-like n=1 Tax=Watersipora subatra TaxID=2589382 RepID=UPI00355B663C